MQKKNFNHHLPDNLRALRGNSPVYELIFKMAKRGLVIGDKAYSSYENSRTEPNLEIVKKIADFYGLTVDQLVYHKLNKQANSMPEPGTLHTAGNFNNPS